MTIRCPTCGGLGRVPVAMPDGAVISYCGPNDERVPHEACRTCGGQGWVEKWATKEPGHAGIETGKAP